MNELLLDASSLYARSFFAAQNSRHDSGISTDCPTLSYALRTLIHLLDPGRDNIGQPIHRFLAAWDGAQNPKKQRSPKPPEFHELKGEFQELLEVIFQPVQCVAGVDAEADDIVATAVAQSEADCVYVVSGDKDLSQLHAPRVSFYDLNQKCLLSPHLICSRWGVKAPSHVALALAIIGDKVDNIKGIPGWGAKKTAKLFESVRHGAPLDEALDAIVAQIPAHLQDDFWASLDRTLLKPDVPGVPASGPLVYADPDFVDNLGLGLGPDYLHLVESLEMAGV